MGPIRKTMIQPINKKLIVDIRTEIFVKKRDLSVIKKTAKLQTMPNKTQPVDPLKIVKQNGVYVPAIAGEDCDYAYASACGHLLFYAANISQRLPDPQIGIC